MRWWMCLACLLGCSEELIEQDISPPHESDVDAWVVDAWAAPDAVPDPDDGVPPPDGGPDDMAATDAQGIVYLDGRVDAAPLPADAALPPDDAGPRPDTAPPPAVDCSAIAARGYPVCAERADACEVVFEDGAGCTAVCALAGLGCAEALENVDDMCAADRDRPAIDCDSGHQSDYCVCAGPADPNVDPPPMGDRFERLLAERVGFGRNARGGDPDRVYRVTNRRDAGNGSLRAALEDDTPWWIVFDVDGTIVLDDDIRIRSRKTIDGRGRDVTIDGTLRVDRTRHVIVSDVKMTRSIRGGENMCDQDGDGILITGRGGADPGDFESRDIWINHVEFFDGGDGLLDIRGGSNITVSWCRFHTHKKASLAWRDSEGDGTPGMHMTWHHNHFDGTSVRNPRFHYGWAHMFNNVWDEWWQYGAASYDGARMLTERNVFAPAADCNAIEMLMPCVDQNPCGDDNDLFVNRQIAVQTDGEDNAVGYARSVEDLLLGNAVIQVRSPERVPDPGYAYRAEVADMDLAERVRAGAGPRVNWR